MKELRVRDECNEYIFFFLAHMKELRVRVSNLLRASSIFASLLTLSYVPPSYVTLAYFSFK